MKVIFLDVDGVLNSIAWRRKNKNHPFGTAQIDPSKVKLLKQIIDKTGAKVVLSSTWRNMDGTDGETRHPIYDYLVDELRKCGVEIFSRTPLINNDRPKEIKAWLNESSFEVERFVCLDDDFGEEDYRKHGISGCLVKIPCFWSADSGLNQEHVEKAIQILNE